MDFIFQLLPSLLGLFNYFVEKANLSAKAKQRMMDIADKMQVHLDTSSKIMKSWKAAKKDRAAYIKKKRAKK